MKYKYKKNDEKIYYKLTKYGSLETARKNAHTIHIKHFGDTPADSESCTTVYKFFDEVEEKIKEIK